MPESVLRELRESLWSLGDTGIGVMECSHRSKAFDDVIESAKERLARLLRLDEDQEVLFLHGGARTQFHMVPQNLLRGGRAAYIDTGTWSAGALKEASRFGDIDVVWSSASDGYTHVPRQGELDSLPQGLRYLHYTSNNTVAGSEFHYVPDPSGAWLVCDMSSDVLSRDVDGSKFDLIYAGAQKNLGPSGTTLVVLRRSLLAHCDADLPVMSTYGIHVKKSSMYNTPCTFAIYAVERVAAWIEDMGGVAAVEAKNKAQAGKIYDVIDGSDFWRGKVRPHSRSLMNVTFTTGDAERDTRFVAEATAEGLIGLKGHRSVGGLRASIYNAQRDESVDALVAFMNHFEDRQG
jgi:phosphoserine aminotransferase